MILPVLCVASFISSVLSCHYGSIWNSPFSTNVSLNERATFYCEGDGNSLQWFIDGADISTITHEEFEARGISYYTLYYYRYCDYKYSYLSLAGNCLNNKTDVYCVIWGNEYNSTSPVAELTVQGDPVVIDDFKLVSTTTKSITVSWDVTPVENSSLTLNITDSYGMVKDSINVTGMINAYTYTEPVSPDPCNIYTFTLTLQTLLAGCNNISTISAAFAFDILPKPDNVSSSYSFSETLLTVRFQIHQCFRDRIQLLLVGADGISNSSDLLQIEALQLSNKFYKVDWNVKLKKHSSYFLTVLALDMHRTSISDITEINTYNVKDVTMARNTDSVCFRCITVMVANDCYVSIEPLKASTQPTQLNASCYSFTDNGTYIIYAHDIDENGKAILIPAIVKEYIVDWIIPLPESSSTNIAITLSASSSLSISHFKEMSSYSSYDIIVNNGSTINTVIEGTEETVAKDQALIRYILGGLCAVSAVVLLIVMVVIPIIVFRRRKRKINNNNRPRDIQCGSEQRNPDVTVITKTDSAYELMQIGNCKGREQTSSGLNSNNYTLAQADAHIYDDPDLLEESRSKAQQKHLYVNVVMK